MLVKATCGVFFRCTRLFVVLVHMIPERYNGIRTYFDRIGFCVFIFWSDSSHFQVLIRVLVLQVLAQGFYHV